MASKRIGGKEGDLSVNGREAAPVCRTLCCCAPNSLDNLGCKRSETLEVEVTEEPG